MARRKLADAPALTQERLRKLLSYDPGTGHFWRYKAVGASDISKPAGERHSEGYVQVTVDCVRYHAHRLAWFYVHGHWPTAQIDHINGIRNDNRIANLREATNTENCRHGGLPRHNTSGFKGAIKWRGRWAARIKVNKKVIHLGMFDTPEQAHEAYCKAAQEKHGEFWNPGDEPSHRRKIG
jgi:hypothetical protein